MSKDKHDKTVEDSFPASDPPANSGITGPRAVKPQPAPHRRDDDSRRKARQTMIGTPPKQHFSGNTKSAPPN